MTKLKFLTPLFFVLFSSAHAGCIDIDSIPEFTGPDFVQEDIVISSQQNTSGNNKRQSDYYDDDFVHSSTIETLFLTAITVACAYSADKYLNDGKAFGAVKSFSSGALDAYNRGELVAKTKELFYKVPGLARRVADIILLSDATKGLINVLNNSSAYIGDLVKNAQNREK